MSVDLIHTKISIPPLRIQLVHRERLYRRLDAGKRCKLTLVTAPAGFGKSTLLSSWAERHEMPMAWYALDEQDNDPDRFLSYFLAALQSAEPRLRLLESTTALRQTRQAAAHETLLTLVANEFGRIREPLGMVLDDYHAIHNPAVDDILAFLLEYLPSSFQLFVASRHEPGFSVARLRAGGQLLEITAKDLRFTTEETARFLKEAMGLHISPEDIAALEARTEGWIAGLQLAALSLEGREDSSAFITSLRGTDRYILDYLAEEVFSRLPDVLRSFLLRISIAERFNDELCAALVEDSQEGAWTEGQGLGKESPTLSARAILEFLDNANLFVVPLDHERRWYRFHQLFADFLQDRLKATQPTEIPDLHRRASAWYSAEGFFAEAIQHALLARDPARAAKLIEDRAKAMLAEGQTGTLARWIEALPDEVLSSRPALQLALAWSQLLSDAVRFQAGIQRQVSQLSASLNTDRKTILQKLGESDLLPSDRDVLGQFALLLAFTDRDQEPHEATIALFQAALASLPEEDFFTRVFALGGLASTYARQGNLSLAERIFAESAEISQRSNSQYAFLVAKDWEATMQAAQGQLTRAASSYRRVIEQLSELAADQLPLTAHAFVGLADILREQNDLEGALEHVTEGLRRGRLIMDRDALREGYLIQARILHALGDETGWREALEKELQEAHHTGSQACISEAESWEAMLNLARGELPAAMRWASKRGLLDPPASQAAESLVAVEGLALARLLIAQRKLPQAVTMLKNLLRMAEETEQARPALEVRCVLAPVLQANGDREEAMRMLAKALLLGEPEGYMRCFVDEGPQMAALLRSAASHGHSPAYVERILDAFGQALSAHAPVDPLTERELEILRLLSEGLSNSEIAAQLVIAQSTVKTHINHIYSKLGVTQRTQAVARAQELHLLP